MQLKTEGLLLPLLKAAAVHLLTFVLLFSSYHATSSEEPLEIQVKAAPVIQAKAVSSDEVKKLVKQKQQRQDAAARAERERLNRIKKEKEKKQKAIAEKKRKARAEKKRKEEAEKKRKAEAEKQRKAEAEKKRKQEAEKKRQAELEKQRQAEAEKQRQAAAEQARIQAEQNAAREQKVMSELQKYKALITNKISRNWIVGNASGVCVLDVRLGSGGFVLDVNQVSGEEVICRSAKAAVYKADPLPVPADMDVFNKMRTIRLTLDPQER